MYNDSLSVDAVSAAQEISVLSDNEWGRVLGVASLDDELFILHCRWHTARIDVYSTSDFTFLHQFSIPGLSKDGIEDFTSCDSFSSSFFS